MRFLRNRSGLVDIHMRLLLIEDHTLFREAVCDCLRLLFPSDLIGEAASENDARSQLSAGWDLIVLDLGLPDGGGFNLISYIKSHAPNTRVLVMTAASEESHALAALESGANGFVPKRASLEELLHAIRELINGSRYFSKHVMSRALDEVAHVKCPGARLSARELDVLRLTADGLSCSQIAEIIHISPKTVETYRTRLHTKLNTRGVAGLVRFALSSAAMKTASGA